MDNSLYKYFELIFDEVVVMLFDVFLIGYEIGV